MKLLNQVNPPAHHPWDTRVFVDDRHKGLPGCDEVLTS